MQLFNKFRDTVFLKEGSELENKLKALKSIRESVQEKEKIDKEIKILEAGLYGENAISFELKNSNIGMYILHDINLEYSGLSAQIDYIIYTPAHCYFVECKNLIGDICINSKGEFSREYQYNGKNVKEAIYSPYTQAVRHVEVWKKIWASGHSNLINIFNLGDKAFENFYKPLVIFANQKGMLKDKFAPKNIKDSIIRVDQLNEYLKKDIESIDKFYILSPKEMKEHAEILMSWNIKKDEDYISNYTMIDDLVKYSVDDEELKEKLIRFRLQKSKEMNVPAYYIFTNEQMEKIIRLKPKTLDALKSAEILEKIKLKCHGKEIIEIFNKNIDI